MENVSLSILFYNQTFIDKLFAYKLSLQFNILFDYQLFNISADKSTDLFQHCLKVQGRRANKINSAAALEEHENKFLPLLTQRKKNKRTLRPYVDEW